MATSFDRLVLTIAERIAHLEVNGLVLVGAALSCSLLACMMTARIMRSRISRRIAALTKAFDVAVLNGSSADFPMQLLAERDEVGRLAQRLAPFLSSSLTQMTRDRETLEAILANMTQGLCMFDRHYHLVVSNARFREIYGLTEAAVRHGMHIGELLDTCEAAGNYSDGRRAEIESTLVRQLRSLERLSYLDVIRDGKVISVTRTPIAAGGWVTTFEDVTEQKRVEDRIEYLAHHDTLTGLSNRTAFREKLNCALRDCKPKQQVALLYLDLDHFKEVNDMFGHPVGDEILRLVAVRLRGCLRRTSVAARLGGDEFAVIETDLTWTDEAGRLAARMVDAISAPYQIAGQQIIIGTSIGIAMASRDGTLTEDLVKFADTALYRAKSEGKNTYRYFQQPIDVEGCSNVEAGTASTSRWVSGPV